MPVPKSHDWIEYVKWSHSYSMGVKAIDDQHKGLLNFVNDVYNHASGNEEEEKVYFHEVIHHAVDYIKTHFADEEKYMIATRFPGYAAHKKVHDQFVLTVVNSSKEFESGKRLVLDKFAHFLRDWILSHIAIMDKQYSEYFWKVATRKENGKLSITLADLEQQ